MISFNDGSRELEKKSVKNDLFHIIRESYRKDIFFDFFEQTDDSKKSWIKELYSIFLNPESTVTAFCFTDLVKQLFAAHFLCTVD